MPPSRTTITGPAKEAETSPRGLVWPPLPAQRQGRLGAHAEGRLVLLPASRDLRRRHLAKEKPIELGNYPYPIFVVYARSRPTQVYSITKAMIAGYDAYKDSAPGAGGLAADRQTKNWVVPVHPGAVKALKEAGQWSDDQEAHNNALFKRQEVLAAAWADYGKSNPPSDDKAFLEGWMKARAAALAKASMPNGFD